MAFPRRETDPKSTGRRARTSLVAVFALIFALGMGGVAVADPIPSQDDVDEAQQQVAKAVSDVAAMDLQIAQLEKTQQAALDQAAVAGEAYNQAVVAYESAVTSAASAKSRSDEANANAAASRGILAGLARDGAQGGSLDQLSMYLTADGIDKAISNANASELIGGKADQALQQYQADAVVAQTLQQVADDAVADETTKKAAAEDALTAANQAQADADAAIATAATQRSTLVSDLAAAQNSSVEVEQARQDGLAAQRQAAIEEEARKRIEEAAKDAPPAAPPTDPTTPAPAPVPTAAPPTAAPPTVAPSAPAPTTAPTTAPTAAPTKPPAPPPTPPPGSSGSTAAQGQAAVDWAKTKTGLPYLWGATGPDSYDCSGLTSKAWASVGINLRRTSRDQYTQASKVTIDSLRPGDLLFWARDTSQPSTIYHVAIYAGNNQMVEAARPGVASRLTAVRWDSALMPYGGRP